MSEDSPSAVRGETRRLAAIMFTDIVGFSRQMGADEARMLRLLDVHNQIIRYAVEEHRGTVIKTVGDAFLVDFPSVVNAVQCAQHIQTQFHAHNTDKDSPEQIHVRIGIHSGDIVQRDGDVFGDGVNIASRLQGLAEPDAICISDIVYRDVAKKLDLGTVVSLGRPKLKGITEPFPVYALLRDPSQGIRQTLHIQSVKLKHKKRVWQVVAVLVTVGVISTATLVIKTHYFPSTPQSLLSGNAPTLAAPLPLPGKPSLIVLPFDNMSKDPDQDYFSNGITEVLTADLSRLSNLFVIARNTAFTYKGKAANVKEVGKELGVRYVLEGSVQRVGEQVRIVAQLVDTTTDAHVWSERYDRPFTDLFALQDEIVQKIVTTLKLQLSLQEQGFIVRKTTENLEAYDCLLRGVEQFFRRTQETNAQARQMFEKALALDPQYAEAYAWLGATYDLEWAVRWSVDPQTLERAWALAHQALALDDSLPLAHSLLGQVYAKQRQYDQAIVEGERAIVLDPNNADSYQFQAEVLNMAGRPHEALPMIEQAMRLNPRYPPGYSFRLGWTYQLTGRYTEAIAPLKESGSRNPSHAPVPILLAFCYVQQWASQQSAEAQPLAQAVAAAQRGLALNDALSGGHLVLGYVSLYQKQYEPAIAEMERGVALAPNDAGGYAVLAETLSRVGRAEDAVRAAGKALRLQSSLALDQHLSFIGSAYYLAGRPEEAIAPLKQSLTRYPNILDTHLTLAAVYSELGKDAEARAEVAEVLRINPKFSLEVHEERAPIKDRAVLERHLAALRKAGLK
jgi:adenylate cyclase